MKVLLSKTSGSTLLQSTNQYRCLCTFLRHTDCCAQAAFVSSTSHSRFGPKHTTFPIWTSLLLTKPSIHISIRSFTIVLPSSHIPAHTNPRNSMYTKYEGPAPSQYYFFGLRSRRQYLVGLLVKQTTVLLK